MSDTSTSGKPLRKVGVGRLLPARPFTLRPIIIELTRKLNSLENMAIEDAIKRRSRFPIGQAVRRIDSRFIFQAPFRARTRIRSRSLVLIHNREDSENSKVTQKPHRKSAASW